MTAPFPLAKTGSILALAIVCIVTLMAASSGCTAAPDPVRIGLLLPSTGPTAMHSLDGLAWAADALNREGGRPVEFVYRDTSTGNVSEYAEELAGRKDIDVIIGPATSVELIEIAPLVTAKGKLLISPSATSALVAAEFRENDLVWRTCSGDGEQLKAIFGFLSVSGVENVSLVAENGTYGATFVRLAPAAATRHGVRLTGTACVDAPDDIAAVAARVAREEPDLVVAAVYPEEAAALAEALSPIPLLLADAGRSPSLIERLGERSEGISGTSLAPDPSTGYAIAHDEVFGEEPPPFAAQAYDALLLAVYTSARQEAAPGEPLAASLRWVVSGDGIMKGWDPREASEAAAMIRAGAHPAVTGASGPLRFGENSAAGPLAGYYTRWTVEGGAFSESTPVASAEVPVRLPALAASGGAVERPVVWMVYPLEKGDRSFADSAYRGLFRAEEAFDFTKREFTYADLALLDAVFAAQNFTEKPDLVITEGFQFTDASRRWAAANPDIRFVTLEQEDYGLPNACDAQMVPYGASYLAGVMAANMTETGRIGAVAGAPVGVIEPFVEGFRAGAAAYDPAVNVTVLYVAESFEGFGMPERAGDLARDLRSGGVDVILMIAGSSNTGIVDAVRETSDVFLIGEDTDQSYLAPNLVAASVVKNIDAIVYCAVEDEVTGRFRAGQEVWALEDGGTGLFVSPRFSRYAGLAAEWHDRAIVAEDAYLKTAAVRDNPDLSS